MSASFTQPTENSDAAELSLFRDSVSLFFDRHAPVETQEAWRDAGVVERTLWTKAGDAGLLCPSLPELLGGPGGDFRHEVIVLEEMGRRGLEGFGVAVHSGIVTPYIAHFATAEQQRRWLPRAVSGDAILAIAMTEPGTGSDLRAIRTRAVRVGDTYVINGQKTFISNGQSADIIVVACQTGSEKSQISLIAVDTAQSPGVIRGRNLKKMGREAQDTSELFFENVTVPAENLLGGTEGHGFAQMMEMLPQERLIIAVMGQAMMERAYTLTHDYVRERRAFGNALIDFQNTKFKMAEAKTEIAVSRAFLDKCLQLHLEGALDAATAAMAKLWISEAEWRVIDQCLQLFGGYGYMDEYSISRLLRDARVDRIHGGTSEIMKTVIARSL